MAGSVLGKQDLKPLHHCRLRALSGRTRTATPISRSCGAFVSELGRHESELSSGALSHRASMAGKCRAGNSDE